jgi:MFS family permease
LSIAALSALLWATIAGPDHGWTSRPILVGYAIGVVLTAAFILWELNRTDPMLDLGFFRNPAFSAATLANVAMVMAWSGTAFIFVQLLQSVLGYSPLEAGLRLAPFAIVGAFGGLFGPPLAAKIGRKKAICLGLGTEGIGSALLFTYHLSGGYTTAAIYMTIFSAGQSVVFSQAIASVMDSVPREKSGVASGANNTCRQLGLAFGVALGGSILSSRYRSELATRSVSLGLDETTLDQAGKSIASAVQTSSKLPGAAGEGLLSAARDAFIPAMHSAMLFAVGMCVLGIAVTAIWLPDHRAALSHGHSNDGDEHSSERDAPTPIDLDSQP